MNYRDFEAFTNFLATYNIKDELREKLNDSKQKMGENARTNSDSNTPEERAKYFKQFKDDIAERIKSLKEMRDLLGKFSGFVGSKIMHNLMFNISVSIETLQNIDYNIDNILANQNNKGIKDLIANLNANIDTFSDQSFRLGEQMELIQDIYSCNLFARIKLGEITIEEVEKLKQNKDLTDDQREAVSDALDRAQEEKKKAEEEQEKESAQSSIDDKEKEGEKENTATASAPVRHRTRKQAKAHQKIQKQNSKARQKDGMPMELQKRLSTLAKEYVAQEGMSYAQAAQKVILDYRIEQLNKEVTTLNERVAKIKESGKRVPLAQEIRLQSLQIQIETLQSDKYEVEYGKKSQKQDERMIQNQQRIDSLEERLRENKPKTSALSRYISARRAHRLETLIANLQQQQLLIATKQYCMVNTKQNVATRRVERASVSQARRNVITERTRARIDQLRSVRDRALREASAIYQDYGRPVVDRGVEVATTIADAAVTTARRGISRMGEMMPSLQESSIAFNGAIVGMSPELLDAMARYRQAQEEQARTRSM